MTKVSLIDYGIGNLLSVERAFRHVGADLQIARTPEDIMMAEKIILPGVGAFKSCVDELNKRGLVDAVHEAVKKEKPLLGICVGMQMLFEESEEFGISPGLGFIKGRVKAIPEVDADGRKRKIPHISWTSLEPPQGTSKWDHPLLKDVPERAEVYFVHSFTAFPEEETNRIADANYEGTRISAIVAQGNLFATQFHPEKSGPTGLQILKNFTAL